MLSLYLCGDYDGIYSLNHCRSKRTDKVNMRLNKVVLKTPKGISTSGIYFVSLSPYNKKIIFISETGHI